MVCACILFVAEVKLSRCPYFLCSCQAKDSDYHCVLQVILHLLPQPPSVKKIVCDFEAALWTAMREVFPRVYMQGCAFHWAQSIRRKIQNIDYMGDSATQKFCRKLMALPYLPAGIFTNARWIQRIPGRLEVGRHHSH